MNRLLKYSYWLLVPLLITSILVFIISLTDIKNAKLIASIRIEFLVIALGALLCFFWGFSKLLSHNAYQKKANALAEQKKQLKEEHKRFMSRLDHELKNPLTGIQLGLENLQQLSPESKPKIAELKNLSQRLSQLTTDLRKLATFEEQALSLENVNISELLEETIELVKEEHPNREITLNLPTAPWPIPDILVDRDLLQLAVYNLMENAIKYSDQDDQIELRATDDSNNVKIEIADTGLGIPNDELNSVWEELFRARNGRDRKGTGIGLSLVKRIIERHNGHISIDSIEKKGTRVGITLPIHKVT